MTRRDTIFYTIGAGMGLFVWAYLVERTLTNLPKLSDMQSRQPAFFPAQRTYGSVVGGHHDRIEWSTEPAT